MSLKQRVWTIMEHAEAGDKPSKVFDIFILSLIVLNVAAVMIGTVKSIEKKYYTILYYFEIFSVIVFTIEYLSRVWSCVTKNEYSKTIVGRLKFLFQPMSLVDLCAILPFYLPFVSIDLRFLRILRLFRIVRIVKIGRYYNSLNLIARVLRSRKEELVLSAVLMMFLLIISAAFLYYAEYYAQPERYSSIPASLWWAVTTLTTLGYGDVYPITPLGKVLASIIAILGIGMFALPTGILGSGFVEEIQKRNSKKQICPHCGKETK